MNDTLYTHFVSRKIRKKIIIFFAGPAPNPGLKQGVDKGGDRRPAEQDQGTQ
jgi:hypothetical protein